MEPLDLVGELPASFGQIRSRRVPGDPVFLPCGLSRQQFLLPVTQRRGLPVVMGIDGGFLLTADPGDLLVQVTSVRPLLGGRQPVLGRIITCR